MATSPLTSWVPMEGRNKNGYITTAFLGSPWWGEFNLEKNGCAEFIRKKGGGVFWTRRTHPTFGAATSPPPP